VAALRLAVSVSRDCRDSLRAFRARVRAFMGGNCSR